MAATNGSFLVLEASHLEAMPAMNGIFISQEGGPAPAYGTQPPNGTQPLLPQGGSKPRNKPSTRPASELHGGRVLTTAQCKVNEVLVSSNKANPARCKTTGLAPALAAAIHNSKKSEWSKYAKEASKGANGAVALTASKLCIVICNKEAPHVLVAKRETTPSAWHQAVNSLKGFISAELKEIKLCLKQDGLLHYTDEVILAAMKFYGTEVEGWRLGSHITTHIKNYVWTDQVQLHLCCFVLHFVFFVLPQFTWMSPASGLTRQHASTGWPLCSLRPQEGKRTA
jgi:hypothetical protein